MVSFGRLCFFFFVWDIMEWNEYGKYVGLLYDEGIIWYH